MSKRVVITGLGPVSGLGLGMEPTWQAMIDGRSAVERIDLFDPAGFASQIGAHVRDLKLRDFVPKSYRKATKVMSTDIEYAVAGADLAARDAGLCTAATDPDAAKSDDFVPTYPTGRVGCHIGAGLIAAELTELTSALAEAVEDGTFSIHKWGEEGIFHLTPLWLLKYLPNMPASHIAIFGDLRGPNNSITARESSANLAIGEAYHIIKRGSADILLTGATGTRIHPMRTLQTILQEQVATGDDPTTAGHFFPITSQSYEIVKGPGPPINGKMKSTLTGLLVSHKVLHILDFDIGDAIVI